MIYNIFIKSISPPFATHTAVSVPGVVADWIKLRCFISSADIGLAVEVKCFYSIRRFSASLFKSNRWNGLLGGTTLILLNTKPDTDESGLLFPLTEDQSLETMRDSFHWEWEDWCWMLEDEGHLHLSLSWLDSYLYYQTALSFIFTGVWHWLDTVACV